MASGKRPPRTNRTRPAGEDAGAINKRSRQTGATSVKPARPWWKNKRFIFIFSLSLLTLILLFVFLLVIPRGQIDEAFKPSKEYAALQKRDFPGGQPERIYPIGDALALVSGEELILENYSGEQIFAYNMHATRPVLVYDGPYGMCGDREGQTIIAFSRIAPLFEAKLDGVFAGAARSVKGNWAVIDEQSGQKARVHLFSEDGQRIYSLSFARSGNPISLAFTNDGKFLDIILLNSSGSRLETLLRRYDLEGGLIAQKAIETYNSLFYSIKHDRNNHPVIHSSSEVLKIDYAKEELLIEQEFSSILAVVPLGDELLVFANTQSDGFFSIYALSAEGALSTKVENIGRVSNVQYQEGMPLVYYTMNNVLATYDIRGEKKGASTALDGEIFSYAILEKNRLNVVNSHGARVIQSP